MGERVDDLDDIKWDASPTIPEDEQGDIEWDQAKPETGIVATAKQIATTLPSARSADVVGEAKKGALRGIDTLQGMGYGALAAVAKSAGRDDIAQSAADRAALNRREVAANPASVAKTSDIVDAKTAIEFLAGGVAQQGIQQLPNVALGLYGRGLAAARYGARMVPKVAGYLAGQLPASYLQELGITAQEGIENVGIEGLNLPGTFAAPVAGALLDTVGAIPEAAGLGGGKIVAKTAARTAAKVLARAGLSVAADIPVEGVTEGLQTYTEAIPNLKPGEKLFTPERKAQAIEEGKAGALISPFISGPLTLAGQIQEQRRPGGNPPTRKELLAQAKQLGIQNPDKIPGAKLYETVVRTAQLHAEKTHNNTLRAYGITDQDLVSRAKEHAKYLESLAERTPEQEEVLATLAKTQGDPRKIAALPGYAEFVGQMAAEERAKVEAQRNKTESLNLTVTEDDLRSGAAHQLALEAFTIQPHDAAQAQRLRNELAMQEELLPVAANVAPELGDVRRAPPPLAGGAMRPAERAARPAQRPVSALDGPMARAQGERQLERAQQEEAIRELNPANAPAGPRALPWPVSRVTDTKGEELEGMAALDQEGAIDLTPPTDEELEAQAQALSQPLSALDQAAHQAATSPLNEKDQPTPEQRKAGKYEKGRVVVQGLPIDIENPKGSVREGKSKAGKTWRTVMKDHYGYIRDVDGEDGDKLDVFVGPTPSAETVFVVNQVDPVTGKFDEHKVMLGYQTQAEARRAYLSNYEKGWNGLDSVVPMTMEEFKAWKDQGARTTHATKPPPVAPSPVKTAEHPAMKGAVPTTPQAEPKGKEVAKRGQKEGLPVTKLDWEKTRGEDGEVIHEAVDDQFNVYQVHQTAPGEFTVLDPITGEPNSETFKSLLAAKRWAEQRAASGEQPRRSVAPAEPKTKASIETARTIAAEEFGQDHGFEFVDDPELRNDDGRLIEGVFVDGKVTINVAAITDPARLRSVVREEGAHRRLSSEQGRALLDQYVRDRLSIETLRRLQADYPQTADESDDAYFRRIADEHIAKQYEGKTGAWKVLVQMTKEFLHQAGLINLTDTEVSQAILRAVGKAQGSLVTDQARHTLVGVNAKGYQGIASPEFSDLASQRRMKEISDAGLGFRTDAFGPVHIPTPSGLKRYASNMEMANAIRFAETRRGPVVFKGKLDAFVKHDELFKLYPRLKKLDFELMIDPTMPEDFRRGGFSAQPKSQTDAMKLIKAGKTQIPRSISVTAPNIDTALISLAHELQHAVENREDFSPGSSPTYMRAEREAAIIRKLFGVPDQDELSIIKPEQRSKVFGANYDDFRNYARVTGEINARGTAERRTMTDEQRRERPMYGVEPPLPNGPGEGAVPSLSYEARDAINLETAEQHAVKSYGLKPKPQHRFKNEKGRYSLLPKGVSALYDNRSAAAEAKLAEARELSEAGKTFAARQASIRYHELLSQAREAAAKGRFSLAPDEGMLALPRTAPTPEQVKSGEVKFYRGVPEGVVDALGAVTYATADRSFAETFHQAYAGTGKADVREVSLAGKKVWDFRDLADLAALEVHVPPSDVVLLRRGDWGVVERHKAKLKELGYDAFTEVESNALNVGIFTEERRSAPDRRALIDEVAAFQTRPIDQLRVMSDEKLVQLRDYLVKREKDGTLTRGAGPTSAARFSLKQNENLWDEFIDAALSDGHEVEPSAFDNFINKYRRVDGKAMGGETETYLTKKWEADRFKIAAKEIKRLITIGKSINRKNHSNIDYPADVLTQRIKDFGGTLMIRQLIDTGMTIDEAVNKVEGLGYSVSNKMAGWAVDNTAVSAKLGLENARKAYKQYVDGKPVNTINGEAERFSLKPGPVYYSRLRNAVIATPTDRRGRATIAALEAKTKVNVDADERRWTGFDEWLAEQKAKGVTSVPLEHVVQFLAANDVKVEEKVLEGGDADSISLDDAARDEIAQQMNEENEQDREEDDSIAEEWTDPGEVSDDEVQEYIEAHRERLEREYGAKGTAKFASYQLPGGENYRELLLTLPAPERPARRKTGGDTPADQGIEAAREDTRVAREYAAMGVFQSPHFDESNVLAHVRFNERTSADGKKVLFLEELQSDWAQKGRKKGFGRQPLKTIEEGLGDPSKGVDGREWVFEDSRGQRYSGFGEDEAAAREDVYRVMTTMLKSDVPSAPFVQSTEKWAGLALRRMVRWAAEHGFDQVAWTTGEQQAERYDLSKHITELRSTKYSDGTFSLQVKTVANTRDTFEPMGPDSIPANEMENYVGKDLAANITTQTRSSVVWTGLDLKVGGEGMKGFYDKILPALAAKIGKPWGAKVGTTSLRFGDQRQEGWAVVDPATGLPTGFYESQMDASVAADRLRRGRTRVRVTPVIRPVPAADIPTLTLTPDMKASALKDGVARFSLSPMGSFRLPPAPPSGPTAQSAPDASSTAPAWDVSLPSRFEETVLRPLQNKDLDIEQVVKAIEGYQGSQLPDRFDPYLKSQLYRSRTSEAVKKFVDKDVQPFLGRVAEEGFTPAELDEFLLYRHAGERNAHIARVNPDLPALLPDGSDSGSGKSQQQIDAYFNTLNPNRRAQLEGLAQHVDRWKAELQRILVTSGQETQATIDTWNSAYQNYVPLWREEYADDVLTGSGKGVSTRGLFTKRAVGSPKEVFSPLAAMAMSMEKAITRAEKARVSQAAYGLAIAAPNPDFWRAVDFNMNDTEEMKKTWAKLQDAVLAHALAPTPQTLVAAEGLLARYRQLRRAAAKSFPKVLASLRQLGLSAQDAENVYAEPRELYVDSKSGMVKEQINRLIYNQPHALNVRLNGEDKLVIFNPKNERALQMAKGLKNLDVGDLGKALGTFAIGTRWVAKVNTQYNPIFGVRNVVRDFGTAMLNLSSTPLAGEQAAVTKHAVHAKMLLWLDARAERTGRPLPANPETKLLAEFREDGGPTAYRDMVDSPRAYHQQLVDAFKVKAGEGSLVRSKRMANGFLGLLSDFNTVTETAFRFAAYKRAREMGMSRDRAALLAKDLTVNFDRKGQVSSQIGSLWVFFNASVQGTERLVRTMAGPAGAKIFTGGLLLGALQSFLLQSMGVGDDDEPAQYEREKNFLVPYGDSKWAKIPMPLGFNILPNVGRVTTEILTGYERNTKRRAIDLAELFLDAFNPMGSESSLAQIASPTLYDPILNLEANVDWNGKPIAKMDYNPRQPTPGYLRTRDTATGFAKWMAKFIDQASGGHDEVPGAQSPTPDQIDYLIGFATGGAGRELVKAAQYTAGKLTGEEVPSYKTPLIGGFTVDTKDLGGQAAAYYTNTARVLEAMTVRESRLEQRKGLDGFLKEYPEAVLISRLKVAERRISDLKKQKQRLVDRKASREAVKARDRQILQVMKTFNETVKKVRQNAR